MCLTVEIAHFQQLAKRIRETVASLVAAAPSRGSDFLLQLDQGYAEAAIVFRDFPKAHGNIIRDAVGIALDAHVGGFSQCEKRFLFLSGSKVSVDNFFMTSRGEIFLFETKRAFNQVRKDLQISAARNLYAVSVQLQSQILRATGQRLKHPIQRVFFSYVDEKSPCAPVSLNIGSNQAPHAITMNVFGRKEMNELIGPCFRRFIDSFDDFVGRQIGDLTRGLRLRQDREIVENPFYQDQLSEMDGQIRFGDDDCAAASEDDLLESVNKIS